MKIHHLALRVKDMDASVRFYQTLTGLSVRLREQAGAGEIAYLQNAAGETEVELIAMPQGQVFQGEGLFLCFATDTLDEAHARAARAGMNPSDICQPEPNARYFYAYDPNGLSVQLREYHD